MSDTSSSGPFAFEPPNFPVEDDLDDELEDELEDDELEDDVNDAPVLDDEEDEDDDDDDEAGAVAGNTVDRLDGGTARAVLEHLARSIVEEPDAVTIDVGEARGQTRLSLRVAPGDMGRVIGKRGRVAQAIRAVVRAAAARDGADATVDIVD